MSESHIYKSDIVISPHTNKPYKDGEVPSVKESVIFWCDVCERKINAIQPTIQHLYGKHHKQKLNAKNAKNEKDVNDLNGNMNGDTKVKCEPDLDESNQNVSADKEPRAKKRKHKTKAKDGASDIKKKVEVKCEDCDIVFDTAANAINHFKGSKHIKKIASIAWKKQEEQRKQNKEFLEKRGQGGGFQNGMRGPGMRNDYQNRIGKSVNTNGMLNTPSNFGTNNASVPLDRFFSSMRGGGQHNTYGDSNRAPPTNYFSPPARQNFNNEYPSLPPVGAGSTGYYSNIYNEKTSNNLFGTHY